MKFHPELGPIPTVGIEIEVASWRSEATTPSTVAKELEQAGMMPDDVFSTRGKHDYHCACNVCLGIGTDIIYPVLFKMQRDASLPKTGAEFISSPFHLDEAFLSQAIDAYKIVAKNAKQPPKGTMDERAQRYSEVGLHVHSWANGPDLHGMVDSHGASLLRDVHGTFVGFAPEIFALAASNNEKLCRSLTFRNVVPNHIQRELGGIEQHHLFVSYNGGGRGRRTPLPHVEWRLWEIPYDDEDYVRAAIVISAALTQVMHRDKLLSKLGHIALIAPWWEGIDTRKKLTPNHVLSSFSKRRFNMLKNVVLEGTGLVSDDDLKAQAAVLFDRTEANYVG